MSFKQSGSLGYAQSPIAIGLGLKTWTFDPAAGNSTLNPTSQTIYAFCIELTAGITYTGIQLNITTPGSGAVPTGFFIGLATVAPSGSTGAMIVQSNNLNNNSALTNSGGNILPFATPYTETVTGLRYIVLLKNGVFAGTDIVLGKSAGPATHNSIINPGTNQRIGLAALCGTLQTALPANGANLPAVFSEAASAFYWAAMY